MTLSLLNRHTSFQPSIIMPPETCITWPVTIDAAGVAKNVAACATSSGIPDRPLR